MTVVKINALSVPADGGDELARRFAARLGAVDGQDGFEGFELLRPTDGRSTWLVVTRWCDEDAFRAWVGSAGFAAAHGHPDAGRPDAGHPDDDHPDAGRPDDDHPDAGRPPVAGGAELWSFDVAGGSTPR